MKNSPIRKSARGEHCTLNIVGVCKYDPDKTVLSHVSFMSSGMGMKPPDYPYAVYGCYECHDAIDGRTVPPEYSGPSTRYNKSHWLRHERWWYIARALARTHDRMAENGELERYLERLKHEKT